MTTPPPHGTRNRYQWRGGPCRCKRCKQANAAYHRAWWAMRRTRPTQLRLPAAYLPRAKAS